MRDKGYQIIERNWFTRLGELDIVALNRGWLIFVEVRTTRSNRYGNGLQSVNIRKQQQLRKLALQFMQARNYIDVPIRFDVISILLADEAVSELIHLESAF